jgi:hypothetical protein
MTQTNDTSTLTQGPLIEEWLMKDDFKPVVGQRFEFRADRGLVARIN